MGYDGEGIYWKPGLIVLEKQEIQVWVDTDTLVVQRYISMVLPSIISDDERKIVSLLNALVTFSTSGPPRVLLTVSITGKDPRHWSKGLQKARRDEIEGHFCHKASIIVHKCDELIGSDILRGSLTSY